MIAELQTAYDKLLSGRQRLLAGNDSMTVALTRGQAMITEVQALRQTLITEDAAPLDAGTRMAAIDVQRERRNRQEAAVARLLALSSELDSLILDIVEDLVRRS